MNKVLFPKKDYVKELVRIFKLSKNSQKLVKTLSKYHEKDIAEAITLLTPAERQHIYNVLDEHMIAEIFSYLDDTEKYLEELSLEKAARVVSYMDSDDAVDVLDDLSENLAGYVWEKDKFELNIGIDSAQSYDMHEAYVEAHRAWTAAAEKHEQIICYEDISLELLISNVPTEIKLEYLKKVFKDMDYNDICENIALLKAYFNAQGSIQKAADNLYIHKNTLQYRISKLKEITGLDVRKPTESPALYLAYIITDELINEKYDLPLLLHNTK